MTSPKQIAANQENAKKSSGPKSRRGKSRSRQNAMKHGLASVILEGSSEDQEVNKVARALLGPSIQNTIAVVYAREAAEADLELRRVQQVKVGLFDVFDIQDGSPKILSEEPDDSAALSVGINEIIAQSIKLDRYERRARSRRKKALRQLLEVTH